MFILQNYARQRRAKREAWEKAGKEWVKEKNRGAGYSIYGFSDWEARKPYRRFSFNESETAGVIAIIFLLAVLGMVIGHTVSRHNASSSTKTSVKISVEKPKGIQVGDTVQVVYGDFKDTVGKVVKVGESNAIIKVTKSSYTRAMALADNRYETSGRDNGSLLSIGSLDNLVPYKEVK